MKATRLYEGGGGSVVARPAQSTAPKDESTEAGRELEGLFRAEDVRLVPS